MPGEMGYGARLGSQVTYRLGTWYHLVPTNNALLSVGRRTDCLSQKKICTFETCPWWKLVPQLTCFVQHSTVDDKYRVVFLKKASKNRLHVGGWVRAWVRACVGGCVDFETPGRLARARAQ